MTTCLLFADALRSPEMRHEIAEPISDSVIFLDHDGRRIVAVRTLDEPQLARRDDVIDEVWDVNELGYDELVTDASYDERLIWPELVRRAVERVGADSVAVPPTFDVHVADYLRGRGVDVAVDVDGWSLRRRRKTPWELEGIERAQRAAETAMLTASRMLRGAERTRDGRLRFEGEILTAELLRDAMIAALAGQEAEADEVYIQSGDACLNAHDPGRGPILPDTSCIIDFSPRDRRTRTYADMSRTFVPGHVSEDLQRLHGHCRTALDIAFDALKPGRSDVYEKVCDYFHEQGLPTLASKAPGEVLRQGFTHDLGHGVGLEVHERPWMGRRSDALRVGDVVAVEPGLYFAGTGGVRLEDTVFISDDGPERFTDPYPYALEP